MYPPHHIYCVCDDDARGVSVTNHRVAALSWDPNISSPSRHCLTIVNNDLYTCTRSITFENKFFSILLFILVITDVIPSIIYHTCYISPPSRHCWDKNFHFSSCKFRHPVFHCVSKYLHFDLAMSRPISRASQGCSSNFNSRQMRQNPCTPERQMLSGFWNESQFSSSLKSSVGCCRDSGIEASLHLWTDVVSDWSQFSSFHGKSLRGRTRVSRKQFRSLAT